jgi:hypothetical protein
MANAQSEWKNWNSAVVTGNISKKWSMRLGVLQSFLLTDNYRREFGQYAFQTDYFFNKHFSLRTGTLWTYSPSPDEANDYKIRYYLRGSWKSKLNKTFNLTNALQVEHHLQNQNSSWIQPEGRYSERIIYVARLALNKRLKFNNNLRFLNKLQLAPSVSYWLYYNIGGDSISYFNDAGKRVARQQPNGFHRGRLIVNINSKITDNLSLSLYYMNQSEFNFLCPEYRRINSVRPATNPFGYYVYRPYDDYNVIGLSAMFNFDLYKKKKSSSKKSTSSKNKTTSKKEADKKKKNEDQEDVPMPGKF